MYVLKRAASFLGFALVSFAVTAQNSKPLLLSEAISIGIGNYQSIKAKRNFLNASTALVQDAKNQYLPNVVASVQQSYGTVNGQYGPLIGYDGMNLASGGPTASSQRWDAGFGGLYLLNANWEFFSFGRVKSRISLASATAQKDSADLMQEEFIQGVKIASIYFNLLAAQTLVKNAQANLERALSVQQSVLARTRSGLVAGVDSSTTNAEVSRARLDVIEARNNAEQFGNQLAQLLNLAAVNFELDTNYLHRIPNEFNTTVPLEDNPQLKFYERRINESNVATDFLKKSILPGLNLFGIFQSRASGFDYAYNPVSGYKYSGSYWEGVNPSRFNYVTGVALAWNIISPVKIKQQAKAQQFVTDAYKNDYDQVSTQLKNQLLLSESRIENSLQAVREVPLQYKAASDAYVQKSVLYKNGLTDITDLQLALFALNRSETDLDIAFVNVWQALLLKVAASGDFELFRKQVP